MIGVANGLRGQFSIQNMKDQKKKESIHNVRRHSIYVMQHMPMCPISVSILNCSVGSL